MTERHEDRRYETTLKIEAPRDAVWAALTEVPAGTTLTYSELAAEIGQPGSARAVASACATNGVAVFIPCHRIVRRDGSLAGYRWGVDRKQALLAREGALEPDAETQQGTLF